MPELVLFPLTHQFEPVTEHVTVVTRGTTLAAAAGFARRVAATAPPMKVKPSAVALRQNVRRFKINANSWASAQPIGNSGRSEHRI
jgi:hypothetical protein